jgi:hypothetical protein
LPRRFLVLEIWVRTYLLLLGVVFAFAVGVLVAFVKAWLYL